MSGTSAIISFVAPSFDGGEPITGYTVDDGVGDTCTTTTLSCEIDGLTPGQTYTFSVVATNAVGDSTPSSPAQAVEAISDGVKKKPAVLDQNKCIRCRACFETCPFDAVKIS